MSRQTANKVSVVEAAYLPASSESAWLQQIVTAAAPLVSDGHGALACLYDGAYGQALRGTAHASVDLAISHRPFFNALDLVEPEFADRTWRSLSFGMCSETASLSTLPALKPLADAGVVDVININAFDPSGVGVWLGAPLGAERKRRPHEAETWTRIAAHIGSAFRLRRRSAYAHSPNEATAVLDTRGRIEHAQSGRVADRMRHKLREAVERMERARGPMRRRDADGAIELWRTLVDAELTLLDHFERGGKRYIIAVANPHEELSQVIALPQREREVVVAAAAGRSNKLIAYELGIAHSTVRVLLARAAQRFHVKSRRELVSLLRAHARSQGL